MLNNDKLIIQKLDLISNTNLLLLQSLLELQKNYATTNRILDAIKSKAYEDFDFDGEPSDENKGGKN